MGTGPDLQDAVGRDNAHCYVDVVYFKIDTIRL